MMCIPKIIIIIIVILMKINKKVNIIINVDIYDAPVFHTNHSIVRNTWEFIF